MKLDDVQFLQRNINEEMPEYTKQRTKIPYNFDQFPKNAMVESHYVDNKFLNHHQDEIEEAFHYKLLTKEFVDWYLKQQSYHINSGILNHDGFFSQLIRSTHRGSIPAANMMLSHTSLNRGITYGSDQTTTINGTASAATNWVGQIRIWNIALPPLTIGDRMTKVGLDISATGAPDNIRVGIYDDDGAPNNLLGESASETALINANDYDIVEPYPTVTTDPIHIAFQTSHTDVGVRYTGSSGGKYVKNQSFGAFEDPSSSTTDTVTGWWGRLTYQNPA